MADFVERRWTSRDGLSLYARDYPGAAGPARLPIVCLHGLTRNSKDFEGVAPLIAAAGRRVLVPDVRGRGRSDRDPEPANYVPKTYARDVLGLLDALGIARAVFIGTSMGGIVTMALSAIRRRAVAAAIFNDVAPEIAPEGVARIASYVGKSVEIASWDEAASYVRRINGLAFPNYGDDDWQNFAKRTFQEVDGVPSLDYDPRIMEPLQRGRYKAASAIAWYLFRRLARSRPTLLVRGELSDLVTREIADRMQKRAPSLQRVDIPCTGHAPMLTEPAAIAALAGFLEKAP